MVNMKFKVGDYVRVVNPQPVEKWRHVKNEIGQIKQVRTDIHNLKYYILTFFHKIEGIDEGHHGTVYWKEEIEKVTQAEALVWLI